MRDWGGIEPHPGFDSRPLEICLPASMIEMIDELKGDELLSREAIITAIVAKTLSVRSPEPSEGQPMML